MQGIHVLTDIINQDGHPQDLIRIGYNGITGLVPISFSLLFSTLIPFYDLNAGVLFLKRFFYLFPLAGFLRGRLRFFFEQTQTEKRHGGQDRKDQKE